MNIVCLKPTVTLNIIVLIVSLTNVNIILYLNLVVLNKTVASYVKSMLFEIVSKLGAICFLPISFNR